MTTKDIPLILFGIMTLIMVSKHINKDHLKELATKWLPQVLLVLSPLIFFDLYCQYAEIQAITKEDPYFKYRQILILISGILSMIGFFNFFVNFDRQSRVPAIPIFLIYFAMRTSSFIIPFYLSL